MEILVYGAGGVGGYFGAKLAQAGNAVSVIARGKHLEAIKENGIEVKSIKGDFTIKPNLATQKIAEVPSPELIILGVKSWQLEEAAKAILPKIDKNTMVLPLQNGANTVEKLLKVLPKENVLAGLCFIVSYKEGPGKIRHKAYQPKITFGEIDNSKTERIKKLGLVLEQAEIKSNTPEDIQKDIWKKFLFIVTLSGLGGLTRVSTRKMVDSPYLYYLLQKTAEEIVAIAKIKGVFIEQEFVDKMFVNIKQQAPGTTTSTQRDIMEGKPSELENFNGYIVKQGQELKVPTPINRFIYECLLPMEKQARNS